MLKLAIVLCMLVIVVPGWSENQSKYPYKLYKFYLQSREQVDSMKKLAILSENEADQRYGGHPPLFLTPLGTFKTSYVLIPHEKNQNITEKFRQKHIQLKPVDVANIKQAQVDNEMHKPSEFPRRSAVSNAGSPREGYIITSPRVNNWGVWGDFAQCNDGEHVVGMRLRTEAPQGKGDDTALNAIELLCAAPGSHQYTPIKSLEGSWGNWGRTFYCPDDTTVKGFQLRSEAYQGNGDDTAANNLRIFCNLPASPEMIEGDGMTWGSWTERQNCLNGQAVVGFRTQVEPYQGNGDDTALNNVDMVCGDLGKKAASMM